ncbi:MAG: hypothetical protein TEF_13105 [Rhizobiales bacterium NRL2]|jgi:isoquinoline 1-oxidoreductase beta subunit|nr:MAG: hypothetical protein TEF_13105 [Rhizobiales bacterium NRL2]
MARFPTLGRRQFLSLGALSAAGLLIGCSPELDTIAAFSETDGKDAFRNAWLHIDGDGAITFFVPASEMGQGVQTALTMIVAEEMDADWTAIRTVFAPYHAAFDNPDYMVQVTGGSNSVTSHWEKLRKLGAAARMMLVEAAAESWGVAAADCATEGSRVRHPDGRSAGYGELAAAAARLSPPSDPPLKDAASFRLVGQPVRRLDTPGKISGAPIYGIDVRLPDMLYATVAQSPVVGGTIAGMDEAAALASPGVRAVVPIHNGVAVVADSFWRAKKGLEALSVAWDDGPNADESSARFTGAMKASLADMATRNFDGAAHRLDVEYQTPLLAHQPLEPMNCTAHVTVDFCRVWAPTQNQQSASAAIREVTGLPKDRIEINTTHLGGGFGRRLESDFVRQAVTVARAIGKPVKLLWTREEDMRHDFYRPMSRVRFQIALGQDGMPTNWRVKVAEPSHFQRALDDNLPHLAWIPVESIIGDVNMGAGLSRSFVETNPFPYAVDDLDVDTEIMGFALPTGSHRSVQHSLSGFCKEAVVDECAHAAGIDPVEYRRRLLAGEPRYLGVLELAAEKAGWGEAPEGRFQGIAVHRSFGTWVAEVAEISVGGAGELTIHRIVCAVDCGRVINPAIAESQVHGAVLWGLEGALFSEITVEGGRVEQSNFHDYRVMHLSEAPPVEVHFIDGDAHPTGLGEPGTPPAAGALVNAIFAATGRRIRELPLTRHGFSV